MSDVSGVRTVEANGIRLACREWGEPDGAPLVLLHGLGSDGTSWDGTAPALAAAGHRVYAPDARGHGGSERPGDYSLELMRDDTLALLDALGIGSAAVIGHSMGGAVAYLAAAHAPGRVSRLVLEDPPTPDPADPPREVPTGPADDDTADWRLVADLMRWRNAPDPEWWKLFPAVACPTLVLGGGPTSHLPQDRIALLAELIPDGRLTTIDAGHLIHADRPEAFLAEVTAFLRTA
jgi:pimeloyl-ACP methyl ester carboxylesterase